MSDEQFDPQAPAAAEGAEQETAIPAGGPEGTKQDAAETVEAHKAAGPEVPSGQDEDAPVEEEPVEEAPPSVEPIRQWVSLAKGSCDVRVGNGAIQLVGSATRGATNSIRSCALAVQPGCSEDLVEELRRALTDVGFTVSPMTLPEEARARSLEAVARMTRSLAQIAITADDLIVAVGSTSALSLASFVASSWCGGVELASVPTDLAAATALPIVPRGLDVKGQRELVGVVGSSKYHFVDLDVLDLDPSSDAALMSRAIMAQTALGESEKAFSALWDRAAAVAAHDPFALAEQLIETQKSRGHLVSSTSIAVRQSLTYGDTFVRALKPLVGPETSEATLYAEALRFSARLSAGLNLLEVDDVLAIDELLDRLELPYARCEVEPDMMFDALKADRFLRSRRFLLMLPRALGRVRLTVVEDDLLHEHTQAWCAVHSQI